MDLLLMVLTACVVTLGAYAVFRRSPLGGWPGTFTSSLIGAGFGYYMVSTANMIAMENYLLWVVVVSGGVATTFVLISHYMLGNEWTDDEEPTMFEEAGRGTHGAEGADPYAVELRLKKAA
jgi:hypothetical protein